MITQRRLTHYRVPLFDLMRNKLSENGVDLHVVYGDPTEAEKSKCDSGSLQWGNYQPCKYWLNNLLCWQNLSKPLQDADLVIVTQENKLIYNLLLLFGKRKLKLAFWGHGANLQSSGRMALQDRWKTFTSNHVDWWFAYTGLSVRIVEKNGYMPARITNLENAIDTKSLVADVDVITEVELLALRERLGIGDGSVGLYLGSLYADKHIDFLLEAAQRIAETVPGFHLLIIGSGPERDMVEACAARFSWLHYLGSMQGRDKALYLRLADVFLNPGMVGLTILDAFVGGVPLVTTDCGIHSPKIDYLVNGENGLITENTVEAYVNEVINLLSDPARLGLLGEGAKQSAAHYSIENMAENFKAGILQALAEPCVS